MTPSRLSKFLNHKSPAIGNRGKGAGNSAARKRVSGTASVKAGGGSNRVSKGTQRKAVGVPVPAPPPPDEPVKVEEEKVRFDFKKPATPDQDNMSGESQYIKRGSAEEVNKDQNMITKFNLKAKKKKPA